MSNRELISPKAEGQVAFSRGVTGYPWEQDDVSTLRPRDNANSEQASSDLFEQHSGSVANPKVRGIIAEDHKHSARL